MPTATTYIMLGQATELKVHLSPAWNDMTAKGETVYITKSFSSLSDGIRRDFSRRGLHMATIFRDLTAIKSTTVFEIRTEPRKFIVIRRLNASDTEVGGETEQQEVKRRSNMNFFSGRHGQDDVFVFNISANVGPNCPNQLEDVQLVQFGYFAMAHLGGLGLEPEMISAAKAVVVGAPYSGSPNDPLTIAIKLHERLIGGTQDGHVSVLRVAGLSYYGTHLPMLARLQNDIRAFLKGDFPRIDKHPKCPAELAASIRRSFTGPYA